MMPGDHVLADRGATIFVAETDIEKFPSAAERIVAGEDLMTKEIWAGTGIITVMEARRRDMLT